MNLFKFLTLIFLIESVNTSVKDVQLRNLNLNTVSSLLQILNRFGNYVKYVEIQPNNQIKNFRNKNGEADDFRNDIGIINVYPQQDNPGRPDELKRILIKRLIPHDLSAPKLEFDSKYKTFYRPLVRIHKRKALPKVEAMLNIDESRNSVGMDKYGIDVLDYYDNDENIINFEMKKGLDEKLEHFRVKELSWDTDIDGELLQPFTINGIENYDQSPHVILKKISKLLKKTRSSPIKMRTHDYLIKVLDKLMARSYGNEKSGEDNDPMRPGRPYGDDETTTQRPKKTMLHYPPWNYWTYKKTIYQDVCPDGQAKIANRCIWLPPH